jgi:hypothetical protein
MRVPAFPSLFVFAALASACANGGSDSGSTGGDGGPAGGDASTKGDAPQATEGGGGDGPASGVTAQQACADNATAYCMQLSTCAAFLITTQYGDELTCEARQAPGCLDALAAPGTGWTGANLEACVTARSALDCTAFLYGKPAPKACLITGLFTSQSCLYDAQCGTGYCRIASGASCGNCVQLGDTGAPCTTSADCDGNLLCAGSGTCQPPASATSACSMTVPCEQGLHCLGGTCTAPGGLGATCAAANDGADCDYNQGVYCDGTTKMCTAYAVAQAGDTCGGALPTVCAGDATCFQSLCVAPADDGSACNAMSGLNCMPPSSCLGGDGGMTCALFSASECK